MNRFIKVNSLMLLGLMFWSFSSIAQSGTIVKSLTAGEIIEKIKEEVTCEWSVKTVDTFKAGDPDQAINGIACTFIPTLDVLKRAKERNCNLIITHEPTFYNHLDETTHLEDDPVYQAKLKFIEDNNMVIFRFHDHWHRTEPDGIITGMLSKLDWNQFLVDEDNLIFEFPKMFVGTLARDLKKILDGAPVRVVGDPNGTFTRLAFAPGAPGYRAHLDLLERDDVELLVAGEVPEWETITWIRDAQGAEMNKYMILLGHVNSEEAGMKYCAQWLKEFVNDVPVHFIPAGDPFYVPK